MTKIIPKIQFKIADLDSRLKIANIILTGISKENYKERVLSEYPQLKSRLENINSEEEKTKIINKFFRHIQKEIKGKMIKSIKDFQKTWNFMSEDSFNAISEIIELDWPKHLQNFTINISFLPACLRFLKNNEFDIFYKSTIKEMKETAFHELIHFLYFEKWKKIFPTTPQENFNQPHLEWEISEIIIKAILGDKKIQKIATFKPQISPEYEKIIIEDNFLLNHINKFYKEKISFENFLKTTWKFIQKNKSSIKLK